MTNDEKHEHELLMKNREITNLKQVVRKAKAKAKRQSLLFERQGRVLDGWRSKTLKLEYLNTLVRRRVARALGLINIYLDETKGDDDGQEEAEEAGDEG